MPNKRSGKCTSFPDKQEKPLRLLLVADIHGNLPALEAVIVEAERQGIDGVIAAGDMVGGPQPNEVIALLLACDAWMIQGNNEKYMLGYQEHSLPPEWFSYRQFGSARYSYQLMDQMTLHTIKKLPEQRTLVFAGLAPVRVVHGSPRRIDELVYPDRDPNILPVLLKDLEEAVLLCGHTHLCWKFCLDGKLAVNPGAVTGGLNGDPRAQFAILDWDGRHWQANLQAVAYDVDLAETAYRQSGLLLEGGPISRACLESFHTGKNVPLEFVTFANQTAKEMGINEPYVPDEIWELAEKRFKWLE